MEFVFTITQGRTGTLSLCKLFQYDPAASAMHVDLAPEPHRQRTVTPDVGHMRRFNTHGLTPEIAAFWTRKLTIHREEAVRRGKQRYVETSHMNALCGLVEYIRAASAHSEDRFRFIVLNRALEKIVYSLYKRRELLNVESMWLWYLLPEYPRNLINAAPYLKWHYPGTLAWYVREVEARKAAYIAMLGNRYDVLSVDIDQPHWADIVEVFRHGFEVPADSEIPHPRKTEPSRERSVLEQELRNIFAALPQSDERARRADG